VITTHTPETLRAFTASIAKAFNDGTIPGPVHLSGGNEEALLGIFADIRPEDWVFSTYRSHWHCLLKGVPENELRAEIMAGRSITLQFPKQKIMTSAIVAGHLPIAVGVALQIKRSGGSEKVWAFLGDMAAETGLYHECFRYALGWNLPITFVVEDNGVSVCTPTQETWSSHCDGESVLWGSEIRKQYTLPFPHAGAQKRTNF
jgi:TPP-dependent pyruvate/acetoin dehydrogenase alpha subunit